MNYKQMKVAVPLNNGKEIDNPLSTEKIQETKARERKNQKAKLERDKGNERNRHRQMEGQLGKDLLHRRERERTRHNPWQKFQESLL